jgi:hypothetical protein
MFLRLGRSCLACALLTVLSACAPPAPSAPASSLHKKVEFSILEDYDKGENLAEIAKDFALFEELGVTVWRGSFGWDDYEPSRGRYDFDWLHRFADLAASHRITLRPYIAYTPEWAAAGGTDKDVWNDPPRHVEDWYRFVRHLASEMRRHRNIVSYEIYNEENVRQWWDGSPSAYEEVLRRGIDAVEAGNPDAGVLLGGMVYPDVEWIEAVCGDEGSGRRVDVIPFHAYPETWTPEAVTAETYLGAGFHREFVSAADAACGRKRIWINETGYATLPGRSEEDQSRWWIRAVATFLSEPRIDHLGIYEIKDLRPDREAIGDAPNYHLGITRVDRRKKIAFGTLRRLVGLLGRQPVAPVDPNRLLDVSVPAADLNRRVFAGADGRQFAFVWTLGSRAVVMLRHPRGNGQVIEYSVDGEDKGAVAPGRDGRLEITLNPGQVRYFEIRPASR